MGKHRSQTTGPEDPAGRRHRQYRYRPEESSNRALLIAAFLAFCWMTAGPIRAELPREEVEPASGPPTSLELLQVGFAAGDSTAIPRYVAYLEGSAARMKGNREAAIPLFHRAGRHVPEVAFELGQLYLEAGALDSAAYYAVRAQGGSLENSPEPRILMGRCELANGRANEAAEWFQRAHDLAPTDPSALMNLLNALQRAGRVEEALRLLEPEMPDIPSVTNLYTTRAALRMQAGRQMDALSDLATALDQEPETPGLERGMIDELSRLEDPFSAETVVKGLLTKQPSLTSVRRWWIGTLATSERWAEAIPELQTLVAQGSADARVHVQLGLLLGRQGNREGSVKNMLEAADLDPENPDPWRWLSRVGAEERRWEEVSAFADSLLSRAPSDPEGLWYRAVSAGERGDETLAVASLDTLLSVNPEHRDACLFATGILMSQEKFKDAEDRLRQFLKRTPEEPRVQYRLAVVLERQGRMDDSRAEFDRLLQSNPNDAEALNYSGYMCIDQGIEVEASLARIDRALTIDPGNPAYLDSRGWGLYRLGRVADAVGPLEEAAKKTENAVILAHLGAVYRALGRIDEANGLAARARQLDPENPEVERALTTEAPVQRGHPEP